MYFKEELDWDYIESTALGAGYSDLLNEVMEQEKEDELVEYIENHFEGYGPDEEEVLDFIYETNIEDI